MLGDINNKHKRLKITEIVLSLILHYNYYKMVIENGLRMMGLWIGASGRQFNRTIYQAGGKAR
jgi:hypothetical protein